MPQQRTEQHASERTTATVNAVDSNEEEEDYTSPYACSKVSSSFFLQVFCQLAIDGCTDGLAEGRLHELFLSMVQRSFVERNR